MEPSGQYEHAWDLCHAIRGLSPIGYGAGTVTIPRSEFTTDTGPGVQSYRVVGTHRLNLGHEHVYKLDLAGGANLRYLQEHYPKHVGTLRDQNGCLEAVISTGQNLPVELAEDLRIITQATLDHPGPDFVMSWGSYAREFTARHQHCAWTTWTRMRIHFETGFTKAAGSRTPADAEHRQRLLDALACHPAVVERIADESAVADPARLRTPEAAALTDAGAFAFGIYADHYL